MQNLIIEADKSTPHILFDANAHKLCIDGESYPENTASFYEPVFSWLNQYLSENQQQNIVLDIELLYFNSSSSKVLSDIFDLLLENNDKQASITINWRYHEENDMSLEYGEEFQEDFEDFSFNLISFNDD